MRVSGKILEEDKNNLNTFYLIINRGVLGRELMWDWQKIKVIQAYILSYIKQGCTWQTVSERILAEDKSN